MEHITQESNVMPTTESRYGRNGMDYNFNVRTESRTTDNGETETMYVYETYRFNDSFDYLNWKYENGIHVR